MPNPFITTTIDPNINVEALIYTAPPSLVSIDEIKPAIPDNWLDQLISDLESSQSDTLDQETLRGHLHRHIGDDSTYTYKAELKDQLYLAYWYTRTERNTPDSLKNSIFFSLIEGLPNCTEGVHDRVNDRLLKLRVPDNINQILTLARESLVAEAFTRLGDITEVHAYNRIYKIAHHLGLGVSVVNANDAYTGNIEFDAYKEVLATVFKYEYRAFNLPYLILNELINSLAHCGYFGHNSQGYEQVTYDAIKEKLLNLLPVCIEGNIDYVFEWPEDLQMSDYECLFILNEDFNIVDININNIRRLIFEQLCYNNIINKVSCFSLGDNETLSQIDNNSLPLILIDCARSYFLFNTSEQKETFEKLGCKILSCTLEKKLIPVSVMQYLASDDLLSGYWDIIKKNFPELPNLIKDYFNGVLQYSLCFSLDDNNYHPTKKVIELLMSMKVIYPELMSFSLLAGKAGALAHRAIRYKVDKSLISWLLNYFVEVVPANKADSILYSGYSHSTTEPAGVLLTAAKFYPNFFIELLEFTLNWSPEVSRRLLLENKSEPTLLELAGTSPVIFKKALATLESRLSVKLAENLLLVTNSCGYNSLMKIIRYHPSVTQFSDFLRCLLEKGCLNLIEKMVTQTSLPELGSKNALLLAAEYSMHSDGENSGESLRVLTDLVKFAIQKNDFTIGGLKKLFKTLATIKKDFYPDEYQIVERNIIIPGLAYGAKAVVEGHFPQKEYISLLNLVGQNREAVFNLYVQSLKESLKPMDHTSGLTENSTSFSNLLWIKESARQASNEMSLLGQYFLCQPKFRVSGFFKSHSSVDNGRCSEVKERLRMFLILEAHSELNDDGATQSQQLASVSL